MSNTEREKRVGILSGVLVIAQRPFLLQVLKRITSHISKRRAVEVSSLVEADVEIMKNEPDAVIIDVSDFSSTEIEMKLTPFVLRLPGWIKTFFVDSHPTPSRIKKATEMGVNGVLKAPLSHHGITTLLSSLDIDKRSSANLQESKKSSYGSLKKSENKESL